MAAANINRPGNMENVFENRANTDLFGKIISYDDKFKTLIIELSDGATKTMTWSTFRGAWRKKAQDEMPVEEAIEEAIEVNESANEELVLIHTEETSDDEYIEEIMGQKEELGIEVPAIDPDEVEIVSVTKPTKKRGAQLEYNGKSQNICAWAKEFGMSANTLYNWIYYKHMSVEEAFEKAISKKGGN